MCVTRKEIDVLFPRIAFRVFTRVVLSLVFGVICFGAVALINNGQAQAGDVYDRVMANKTIRCGYFIEPPFTQIDLKTGQLSGMSVAIIEALAEELGLSVKWTEEVSFASLATDLQNGRYDMVCSSIFNLPRAGTMDYTRPYAFVPMIGYVRKGESGKFEANLHDNDWADYIVAGLDGEGATTIVQKYMPQAKMNILPQRSSLSEVLLSVAHKKADIAFVLPSVFQNYNKNNPDTLEDAGFSQPLYVYGVGFGIARGAHDFKAMINNVLDQMIISSELENIAKTYDVDDAFEYPVIERR